MATVQLGSKAVGSIVKIKESGVATNFIIVHKGAPSSLYPADDFNNTVMVLRQNLLAGRQWNSSGANDYANSTIHTWLNNASSGYLSTIDATIRNQIKQVRIPYRAGSGASMTVSSGTSGLSCKTFLLSGYEVGSGPTVAMPGDGKTLDYFVGIESPITAATKRIAYLNGTATEWWLRTPCTSGSVAVNSWFILTTGPVRDNRLSNTFSPRPALVLPATLLVTDDGTVIVNQPPTTPGPVTYDAVRAAKETAVSWGASTDPDGDAITYIPEYRVDTGIWTPIGPTSGLTVNHTVPAGGVYYQVRVKAADTAGNESGYRTGEAVAISYNDPPVIHDDIEGGDLGELTDTGLSYSFSVTDDTDGDVSVEIAIDGKIYRQISVPVDTPQTFELTADEWLRVLNGSHTLTVTATDVATETATRTLTFSRNERVIEFRRKEPVTSSSRFIRVTFGLSGERPEGSALTVFASNNALDDEPVWEDITSIVATGRAHIFGNAAKTADQWALDFHVTLDRGAGTGPCYISGYTYGFDTEGGGAAQVAALSGTVDTLMTEILPMLGGDAL